MGDVRSIQLDLSVSWRDDHCVLAVTGELDIATIDMLAEAVSAALDVTNEVIVDLERVAFADVRGVASLARSVHAADHRGKSLAVRNWPASMERIADVMPDLCDVLVDPPPGEHRPSPNRRTFPAGR